MADWNPHRNQYRAMIQQAAQRYGIDPVLMEAIFDQETGHGTSYDFRRYWNPGGIGGPGEGPSRVYASPQDGFNAMASLIARRYGGANANPYTMAFPRDPNRSWVGMSRADSADWVRNVNSLMNQIGHGGQQAIPASYQQPAPTSTPDMLPPMPSGDVSLPFYSPTPSPTPSPSPLPSMTPELSGAGLQAPNPFSTPDQGVSPVEMPTTESSPGQTQPLFDSSFDPATWNEMPSNSDITYPASSPAPDAQTFGQFQSGSEFIPSGVNFQGSQFDSSQMPYAPSSAVMSLPEGLNSYGGLDSPGLGMMPFDQSQVTDVANNQMFGGQPSYGQSLQAPNTSALGENFQISNELGFDPSQPQGSTSGQSPYSSTYGSFPTFYNSGGSFGGGGGFVDLPAMTHPFTASQYANLPSMFNYDFGNLYGSQPTFPSYSQYLAGWHAPGSGASPAGYNFASADMPGAQHATSGHFSGHNQGGLIRNETRSYDFGGPVQSVPSPLQGYGKDTVPAALTPGEVVIPRPGDVPQTRRQKLIHMAMREKQGRLSGFNTGGEVFPNGPSHSGNPGAETKAGLFDVGPPTEQEDRPDDYEQLMDEPGIIEAPNMDMDNPFKTSIHEFDGKYYILPSEKDGDDPVTRYDETGEHLGGFKSLDDARAFEKKYLGE